MTRSLSAFGHALTVASCKARLPADLMFAGKELARLEVESGRIAKIRADMVRDTARQEEERQRRRGDGG